MKNLIPIILVVVVAGGLWFAMSSRNSENPGTAQNAATTGEGAARTALREDTINRIQGGAGTDDVRVTADGEDEEGLDDFDERNAIERYKSADEALKAVKDGSVDYDDLVLDQFTDLGENCSWCDSFYKSVKELMLSPDTKGDQKSYYAELLAISGRAENIKTLVELVKNASNQEEADLYAEALELTIGKNDVVKYLGEQLSQGNETLREASVAAITNQGSRLAVETIYDHTASRGDPDGYYSLGIGLGEIVPDEDAYPFLQEKLRKRDQYSHLAAKALLNAGLDGLKLVVDVLSNSTNTDFDKEMLKGAKDHVTFGDEEVAYLKDIAEKSSSPVASVFAKEVLSDFEQMEAEADEDDFADEGEEAPMSLAN